MDNMTPTVKQLLIINVMVFIAAQFIEPIDNLFALHYFENNNFQIWQLITHMFMHGSVMHIAFNMFALVSFGSVLERFWGTKRFLFFYFSCGFGAAVFQMGVNYFEIHQTLKAAADLNLSSDAIRQILNFNIVEGQYYSGTLLEDALKPFLENLGKLQLLNQENFNALFEATKQSQGQMVGASGAIYGLLIAFAFMFPDAELAMLFIPVPIKAKYFVPIIVLIDLFLGVTSFSGDNVAHFAHIGGALIGFIMMWTWRNNRYNHKRWN
ncbi:MAG: rhomboid family intramembrane serine protease [Flavobacterium sp.]|nr:rhomboid family intramembrane serine protease [Flavobacterium sp.]